ncbi:46191_t:CDS:1, partial [Gigaspora margarita]
SYANEKLDTYEEKLTTEIEYCENIEKILNSEQVEEGESSNEQ